MSEYEYNYGEEGNSGSSLQPPLLLNGDGGGGGLSSITQQAKQTEALARATPTTASAMLASSSPPPTTAATRVVLKPQPGAKGLGNDNGLNPAGPPRTSDGKSVKHDITTLPVVELSGMKVSVVA